MPRRPPPLALGLMRLPPGTTPTQRTQARMDLALLAARHGYALVETFETDDTPAGLDTALTLIEDLAVRLDADALAVTGHPDHHTVEEFAARVRLLVLRHSRKPREQGSGPEEHPTNPDSDRPREHP